MRIRGLEMLVFRKILRTYLMDDPKRCFWMQFLQPLKISENPRIFFCFFFILKFGSPTVNFRPLSKRQLHSPDVKNCVFITLPPEDHREPPNEAGSQSPTECLVGFERWIFRFVLNPLCHSHQIAAYMKLRCWQSKTKYILKKSAYSSRSGKHLLLC